jgi:hypothetical protein
MVQRGNTNQIIFEES